MAAEFVTDNPELEALFERYRTAPASYVFAPLADACRKAGMLEEAVEICAAGVARHPRYPSGYVVQGKCYFDQRNIAAAEKAFRAVLELDENNLVALKYLGVIMVGRGEREQATEYFQHILALDPEDREIRRILSELKETEQVGAKPSATAPPVEEEDFEGEPIMLGDDDERSDELATTTLADIYAAQGYLDKALRIYREVLKKQPHNEEIQRKIQSLEGGGTFSEIGEPAPKKIPTGRVKSEDKPRGTSAPGGRSETRAEIRPESASAPGGATQAEDKERRTIDDQRSYDQFKKWLDNLSR